MGVLNRLGSLAGDLAVETEMGGGIRILVPEKHSRNYSAERMADDSIQQIHTLSDRGYRMLEQTRARPSKDC
jgi:hypothetical protein